MKKIFFLVISCILFQAVTAGNSYRFIAGTYTTNTSSKGIYIFSLDINTGKSEVKAVATDALDPSYLALSSDQKSLYSISERGINSTISAYNFDSTNGSLLFLNKVSTGGADPCYVSVSDKHVFCANYSGGNIGVFGRKSDGSLTGALQVINHAGSSIDPQRQTKPYVHQVFISPDKKFVLANDLGTDYVTCYSYKENSTSKILEPTDSVKLKAGSGPRHLTFSQDGKYIYVIQELDGTLSTLRFENGKLKLLDATSIVKKKGIKTGAADIHLSPDGKFVYATNRGTANDISCFKTTTNGQLLYVYQTSVEGNGPRNFAISKDGKYILVGNQQSNQIVVFRRNLKNGKLTDTGYRINIPAPVCIIEY
jgi:6-phosphogluconolactonase